MSINHIGKHISRSLNGKSRVQTVKNILFNYSHNDWRQHVDPNIERNVYNETKVYEDDFVSLHISTWKPGYISTINKYTKGECWTKVLKGELIERQYDNNSFSYQSFLCLLHSMYFILTIRMLFIVWKIGILHLLPHCMYIQSEY